MAAEQVLKTNEMITSDILVFYKTFYCDWEIQEKIIKSIV